MTTQYEIYTDTEITLPLLNTIKRGDLIKCNDWKKPLKVQAVTENYFVMSRGAFGEVLYSVCEKILRQYTHNNCTQGYFCIGKDSWIFGSIDGYKWETEDEALEYLAEFESGNVGLSRCAVDLNCICIKRC